MCKSNCQGSCLRSIKNKAIDSKESLIDMMGTLNKMQKCSSVDESPEKAIAKFDLAEITDLKIATSELLADIEITIENSGDQVKEVNSSCAAKDIFKDQNFKERLLVIKNAIVLLEKSLSDY